MKRSAMAVVALWAVTASASGEWKQIGKPGDWGKTRGGVSIGTTLYTIESGGHLYATELPSGKWRKIGKPAPHHQLPLLHTLFPQFFTRATTPTRTADCTVLQPHSPNVRDRGRLLRRRFSR